MTEKEFAQSLRRGLGGAIVVLKHNRNNAQYRGAVLRCCLRDISYDWQAEGTKGRYLYSAICALNEKEYFERVIIEKFLSRCGDRLSFQLADVLFCYAENDSEPAKDAFRAKYRYFADKNGRLSRTHRLEEGFQWYDVACRLFDIDGFTAFKRYTTDMGELLHRDPNKSNRYYYDFFISHAEDRFGKKRVNDYLDKMYGRSDAIKALIDTLKAEELSSESYLAEAALKRVSVEELMQRANGLLASENPQYGIVGICHSFSMHASEADFLSLAQAVLREENETVKALLLKGFWRKPFPLGITPLLEYARSENEMLSENAMTCLEEFKDKRIHDLAVHLLNTKGLNSSALSLLKKNYRKADDKLIQTLVMKSSGVTHDVQSDIRDIYTCHCSADALPVLLRVYRKGDCTYCRYGVVKAMRNCGILPDDILEECLYDSYEDTRKLAKRLAVRKKPTGDKPA